MGSVCCVSARDGTASERANGEILWRTSQYSPSWGVRLDNRGRVAGEEAPAAVMVDRVRLHNRLENKSEPFFEPLPEEALAEENVESNPRKLPLSENVGAQLEAHSSELVEARSISTEVKEIMELPAARGQPLSTMSPDVPSASYLSMSPPPPRNYLAPASSTPSKWSPRIPKSHLLRQGSDSQLSLPKSPSNCSASEGRSYPLLPVSSIESARGSHGGSVDGWSVQSFPESTTSAHRETWCFDSDSLGSHRYKLGQSRSRKSDSHSNELKTCVACSKYLVEKSSFSSQKIVPNNELSVVAVLVCGHVYHADCLEHLTPEISKYDPSCPVCAFGEQQAVKIFEKLLKAETDMKSKSKKRRNRIVSSDFVPLAPGSESSSSPRSSFAQPFLKRHFSLGCKATSSAPDTLPVRKRSLLWSKSSK